MTDQNQYNTLHAEYHELCKQVRLAPLDKIDEMEIKCLKKAVELYQCIGYLRSRDLLIQYINNMEHRHE